MGLLGLLDKLRGNRKVAEMVAGQTVLFQHATVAEEWVRRRGGPFWDMRLVEIPGEMRLQHSTFTPGTIVVTPRTILFIPDQGGAVRRIELSRLDRAQVSSTNIYLCWDREENEIFMNRLKGFHKQWDKFRGQMDALPEDSLVLVEAH